MRRPAGNRAAAESEGRNAGYSRGLLPTSFPFLLTPLDGALSFALIAFGFTDNIQDIGKVVPDERSPLWPERQTAAKVTDEAGLRSRDFPEEAAPTCAR